MSSRNLKQGQTGEQIAADFLEKKGYQILKRNYRTRAGEIDLIVRDGKTLVFVEVKARTSSRFGSPAEAVNLQRIERIHRAGELFLQKQGLSDSPIRIDVIGIEITDSGDPTHVEHFENITL